MSYNDRLREASIWIAAQFGISQALTSLICRGYRYADIGGPIETERKYHRG